MYNWTKRRKKRNFEYQREMIWRRQLENSQYRYQPSPEIYSKVKCQMHQLGLTKELPGRDALKEVLMFLETYKPKKKYQYYILALKVARQKVGGRRFFDENEQENIICSLDDVVQAIRESLRAAGIYNISVKDFIYSLL